MVWHSITEMHQEKEKVENRTEKMYLKGVMPVTRMTAGPEVLTGCNQTGSTQGKENGRMTFTKDKVSE